MYPPAYPDIDDSIFWIIFKWNFQDVATIAQRMRYYIKVQGISRVPLVIKTSRFSWTRYIYIQLIFTYQNSEFKCLALVSIYKINNDTFKW